MAGISDVTELAILELIFRATAWANYAQNNSTTPQTNIGLSLHTADPLAVDTGTAATSEIVYTSYARVNKTRDNNASTGWQPAAAGQISPQTTISFPQATGGAATASHWATASSNATPPTGAQTILWSGAISPTISVSNGVTPQLLNTSYIGLD